MINVYPSESRHYNNHGWLRTHFSFSFSNYYDPDNMGFGPMRVLNDDIVAPDNGFGMHPHREMEIVTLILSGQLKHEDSMGNVCISGPGEIQRMSAGTGVYHSEVNPSSTEEVSLFQMWFEPATYGIEPSYEPFRYDVEAMKNNLLPIVSAGDKPNTATINQDMTMYLSELEAGKEITFTQEEDRRIFFMVIEGEVTLNGDTKLGRRDSARITEVPTLKIEAAADAKFLLIDLP
ncbi:pirin family protein [Brevibacillus dissolubilis]|uniref:pirin family protein n=1 Tax=Brevibacillus dissolubilis TaxID=1844116 RepID=UPI001116BDA4|nr:pirin family protein [Brevibacillus dissolubilis]